MNVIYSDINSVVINNGWVSPAFFLERGVRQGCPLSPLLYCLVVETLGQAIRRDTSIQGIPIPGSNNKQSKVSQYADDTTLILANDFSINKAFRIINIFERGSGSRLNSQKTEGLWLGPLAGRSYGPVNITWVTDKLKILGVYFGNANLDHANWDNRVTKLEKRLNLWHLRTLSLKGKSLIINSLGASGLWYTATVLPMPESIHTRVTKAIFKFLWNGKTEQVRRDVCQLPFDQGGLAVINPLEKSRALKLRWVPRVGDSSYESKWVYFSRYWIGFALSHKMSNWTFLRSNSTPKYLGDQPPPFFQKLLSAVARVDVDFDLLPDHTVKTFYAKLFPAPKRMPCTYAWDNRLATPLPWSHIWSTIYGGLSTNWECDIAWRLAHGVLKTRAYLKRVQRLQVSELCAMCGQTETFSHALCECTVSPQVWDWSLNLINMFYATPLPFSPALALFQCGLPTGQQHFSSNALARYIIKLTLNELWAARNVFTFENKPLTAPNIIAKVKSRIRFRLQSASTTRVAPSLSNSGRLRTFYAPLLREPLSSISSDLIPIHSPKLYPPGRARSRARCSPGRGHSSPGGSSACGHRRGGLSTTF